MTGEWILAGDFNCAPPEFANPRGRAWKQGDGTPVHSGAAAHQGGNDLDNTVSPNIALEYFGEQSVSSDHVTVWCTF